jgi:hypothetical protein
MKTSGAGNWTLHPTFMVPIQCQWGNDHIQQVVWNVKNQSNKIVAYLLQYLNFLNNWLGEKFNFEIKVSINSHGNFSFLEIFHFPITMVPWELWNFQKCWNFWKLFFSKKIFFVKENIECSKNYIYWNENAIIN